MKRSYRILGSLIIFFLVSSMACDDSEPFVNTKVIETQIYQEIDKFRVANGIPDADPFVFQFIMGQEAQLFSAKMSFANAIDTTGLADHWFTIHDKIANGINDATLLQSTLDATAPEIVANWTADSSSRAILLGDYSQCGVGVEYASNQVAYVTVMLMLVE